MKANTAQGNATEGRVYGGDGGLIHIADGQRARMGQELARELGHWMRSDAVESDARTVAQAFGADRQSLCPGCYMVAMFNACVALARANGQSMGELGRTMAAAFVELAENGDHPETMESIAVSLDPPTVSDRVWIRELDIDA